MATMKIGKGPGMRIGAGASVLAAAKAIDTRLVKVRLAAFERAHGAYGEAQRKVDAAEGQLTAAQRRLSERDAVQDEAVETLARALVADGQPILWGANDRFVAPLYADVFAQKIATARLVKIPDVGHLVGLEKPAPYAEAVRSFAR